MHWMQQSMAYAGVKEEEYVCIDMCDTGEDLLLDYLANSRAVYIFGKSSGDPPTS